MGKRILIVDDNGPHCEALSELLRDEGYDVRSVLSARDSVACVGSWVPDVILLDHLLPDVLGLDVLPTLRRLARCPVIVVTAIGEYRLREDGTLDDFREQAMSAGAFGFLTKPVRLEHLLSMLTTATHAPSKSGERPLANGGKRGSTDGNPVGSAGGTM